MEALTTILDTWRVVLETQRMLAASIAVAVAGFSFQSLMLAFAFRILWRVEQDAKQAREFSAKAAAHLENVGRLIIHAGGRPRD
jgi:hypothetical protein